METPTNSTIKAAGSSNKSNLILWSVVDSVLICAILFGNILTICAIKLSRKISTIISNQFILNLALSDLMVGLTLPYHFAFLMGESLGKYKTTCILRYVLIILACSSSIYNLLAIATDRYVAIVHPLRYGRYMTRKMATTIIIFGWILAFTIATVPIYWNIWEDSRDCRLENVLHGNYVNFIVTPMFASIWITMSIVYFRIWREAVGHAKRLRTTVCYQSGPSPSDSKSVQVVLLILGCFSICWMPFFIIVIYIQANGSFTTGVAYESAFTMAVTNSCMNPIIYAWKNTNFRKAFWCLLRCKSPSSLAHKRSFITNHVPGAGSNKKGSMTTNGTNATNGSCHENVDGGVEDRTSGCGHGYLNNFDIEMSVFDVENCAKDTGKRTDITSVVSK